MAGMRLSYLIHSFDDILPMFVDLMNNSYASAELVAIDATLAYRIAADLSAWLPCWLVHYREDSVEEIQTLGD
jgi:hypothetical protein